MMLYHSAVKLIVVWKVLISCRNCSATAICRCSRHVKMSSMYLHQMDGLFTGFWRRCFSNSPMKMMAYDGTILVPIAVTCVCRYVVLTVELG